MLPPPGFIVSPGLPPSRPSKAPAWGLLASPLVVAGSEAAAPLFPAVGVRLGWEWRKLLQHWEMIQASHRLGYVSLNKREQRRCRDSLHGCSDTPGGPDSPHSDLRGRWGRGRGKSSAGLSVGRRGPGSEVSD